MPADTWQAFYASDLQGLYALWIAPALFLLYLAVAPPPGAGIAPEAAPFVRRYTLVFAILTMLDPLAGGPLLRWLGLATGSVATVVTIAFVLLGDFRVFLLLFALIALHDGRDAGAALRVASLRAAIWTLVTPAATVLTIGVLGTLRGPLPTQATWLVYECVFLGLALGLRVWLVERRVPGDSPRLRAYLRALLAFVALYYALWASADALILGVGLDLGWALRIVPNQLYYGLWIPFVYGAFFAPRTAATRSVAQASR